MPLKVHLIIVSCIIVIMTLGWQMAAYMSHKGTGGHEAPHGAIKVVRATLGQNCDPSTLLADVTQPHASGQFTDSNGRLIIKEDNVHEQIAALCDGRSSCNILNNTDALGFDPAPNCFDKQILVEYRCYTYDRLWRVVVMPHETGSIDCSSVLPPSVGR